MVLRESGRLLNLPVNLRALVDPSVDPGVPGGRELVAFTDAITGTDLARLDEAREALIAVLGRAAVMPAAIICANFSRNDRLANGMGIPLDAPMMAATADLRAELGINDYASAANSLGH